MFQPNGRAVIVGGARTPFVRAFGALLHTDAIGLGVAAVEGVLRQTGLERRLVEGLVWGGVVLPSASPNVGREIVLDLQLDPGVEAMTVTRACASGLQAVVLAAAAIERGEGEVLVAGGSDSVSNAEIKLPQKVVHALAPVALGKARPQDWFGVAGQLWPFVDCLPSQPRIAERTTGEVMGQAAERMAVRNGVDRAAQDAFALRSHQRAAAAREAGIFAQEVVPCAGVADDDLLRPDTSLEKLARLRPAFAADGTLTAGNSSALTDGGAAVLLCSERAADRLGLTPRAAFRSWAFTGVDPADQLLIGPATALPLALRRAGLDLQELDRVDLHEAFAAQVLCVLKLLESDAFGRIRLGLGGAVGGVPDERLNVFGGSLALGHPFAATGARMVTTMANALHRGEGRLAGLGICAAGGLGAGAVLERV